MWIRRSFGDDPLYTTLVQTYIDTLLMNGYNFECFVEGGRSRTGKLLPPKFGILNFLLDSVLSRRIDDAIVCPVSTQYDKVIETEYVSNCITARHIYMSIYICKERDICTDKHFPLGHISASFLASPNPRRTY